MNHSATKPLKVPKFVRETLSGLRTASRRNGTEKMTFDEINDEIRAVRTARKCTSRCCVPFDCAKSNTQILPK